MISPKSTRLRPSTCVDTLPLAALFAATLGIATFSASPALAEPDEDAKQLSEKAIYDDYLNLRFDDAEAKLNQAVRNCADRCSKPVLAQMYRDLGVVLVAGKGNKPDGVQAFIKALSVDPAVALNPDLNTPEVETAFAEAQQAAAASEPNGQAATVSGAITHDAPSEQRLNTPLPLFVGVSAGEEVAKVSAFIRGFGMPQFKRLDFAKRADGFAVTASCQDVGGTTGEFQYYIVAYDEAGEGVGRVGNENEPVVVLIKRELEGDAPRLPNSPAPEACVTPAAATQDCPPDFPGCELGEFDGRSQAEKSSQDPSSESKRHWLSAAFQQDFLVMDAASRACGGASTAGYECFYGDGTYRNPVHGEPGLLQADGTRTGGGDLTGGLVPATSRILLGYDFALLENVRLGARVGFALNGGPQLKTTEPVPFTDANGAPGVQNRQVSKPAFLPLHAEARAGYWFGSATSVVRPHVTLSGGLAQVDAKVLTTILEPRRQNEVDCPQGSSPNCLKTQVEAWRATGTGFGAGGVGLMVPMGSNHGLNVEAKFMLLFGESGQAAAAQLGYMVGL